MHRNPLAPSLSEDDDADEMVRRGRNVGGTWIVASAAAFGLGSVARSVHQFALAWLIGCALLAVGLTVRARFWRSARRCLGDATMRRAQWRRAEADRGDRSRVLAAIALVMALIGWELWRR